LEKPENVFSASGHPHFPHAKPIIKIVSLYFKGWWPRERPGPLILWNFAIKIFENISRKVRGGHRLYSGGALLQMINNSGTLFATLISTHIEDGAFWDTPEKLLLTSQASQE